MDHITRRRALASVASIATLSGCVVTGTDRTVTETTTETYDVDGPVAVESETGDVTVRGTDRDDLRVRARKRTPSRESLDSLSLSSTRDSEGLRILARREEVPVRIGATPRMDLSLALPSERRLARVDASGAVDLAAVRGPTRVDGASGDVTVDGVDGAATLGVSSGDLRASGIDGPATVDASSGTVTLSDVGGDAEVEVSSGDVTVADVDGDVDVEASSGDISVAGVQGDVHATASSGDVTVDLPEADAALSLEATSGDIETDGLDLRTDGSRLEATVGEGTRDVRVATSSGDIVVTATD